MHTGIHILVYIQCSHAYLHKVQIFTDWVICYMNYKDIVEIKGGEGRDTLTTVRVNRAGQGAAKDENI
jgi:hypothetical protein